MKTNRRSHPAAVVVLSCASIVLFGCAQPPTENPQPNPNEGTHDTVGAGAALPADYEAMSAADKLATLFDQRVVPSAYGSLPAWPGTDLWGLLRLDLRVTLDRVSDELPVGRKKLVHALGAVAKVDWIADEANTYSGLFRGGHGLARFSLAKDPGTDDFTPGLAIKMFIDGQASENLEVMQSIDGQGANFDFFANPFSNIIAAPVSLSRKIIGDIFSRATPTPNHLSVISFATRDQSGAGAGNAYKRPYQIFFTPAAEVQAVARDSSPSTDFRIDLAKIPAGTTLYDIYAADAENGSRTHIGKLVSASNIIASRYGDERLFFKHQEFIDAGVQ